MKRALAVPALALTLFSVTDLHAAQELPPSGSNLGSVTGGTFNRAHLLIEKKCTSCHTDQRIREALASGKNMQDIQSRMEQKGLKLSNDEQSVLKIFWKETPLK